MLTNTIGGRILCTAGLILATTSAAAAQTELYVDANAAPGGDGLTWSTAYQELSTALNGINVSQHNEVWVAEGVYLPTAGTDESATFLIPRGLEVYGGFLSGDTTVLGRTGNYNNTILSGQIAGAPGARANTDHIVTIPGAGATTSDRTILDGFMIRYGFADDLSTSNGAVGGGILVGDPTNSPVADEVYLRNLTIRDCHSDDKGGGLAGYKLLSMQVSNSTFRNCNSGRRVVGGFLGAGGGAYLELLAQADHDVAFGNVRFVGNKAPHGGGLAVNKIAFGVVSMFNCLMHDNTAYVSGGAFHNLSNAYASPTGTLHLSHCTITQNDGGGVHLDDEDNDSTNNTPAFITSCIIRGNRRQGTVGGGATPVEKDLFGDGAQPASLTATYSNIGMATVIVGGVTLFPGNGNINATSLFQNAANSNFHLTIASPCIDAADDAPITPFILGDVGDADLDWITIENVEVDFDNEPREDDIASVVDTGLEDPSSSQEGISDMGCFERQALPGDAGGGTGTGGGGPI